MTVETITGILLRARRGGAGAVGAGGKVAVGAGLTVTVAVAEGIGSGAAVGVSGDGDVQPMVATMMTTPITVASRFDCTLGWLPGFTADAVPIAVESMWVRPQHFEPAMADVAAI
jgi:hypothetical protein